MARIIPDAYDKLFCRCDGTAQTFEDALTPPKAITANGDATQLPIKLNKSAGFFNGTTDYVVVPNSSDFTFGTGDFNIEGFFNFTSLSGAQTLFDIGDVLNSKGALLQFNANQLVYLTNGADVMYRDWTPTINTWYHIRLKRTSGTTKIYVDAVQVGADYTDSNNLDNSTYNTTIGRRTSGVNYFSGWVKEFRIIKGASTTVTVPTAEYTSTSEANTKLLMHFDTPATSPLGPAIAFDGTGDYLTTDGTTVEWGTGSGTVEFWVNSAILNTGTQDLIVRQNTQFRIGIDVGTLYWFVEGAETWGRTALGGSVNSWIHLAFVKDGQKFNVYKNGKLLGSEGSANPTVSASGDLYVGMNSDGSSNPFTGFLREIRVSDVARYTSSFTPSQTGFTVDANTKLYIKGNENNGVTTFVDSETSAKTVTTNGDTVIKYTEDYRSCIFKDETGKFPYPQGSAKVDFFAIGSGVGYFDGDGDYLSVADSDDWNFGTGTLSIEGYFRFAINNAAMVLIQTGDMTSDGIAFYYANDTGYKLNVFANNAYVNRYDFTPVLNTWHHIAMSRDATNMRLFVNGVKVDEDADSTNITSGSDGVKIGGKTSNYFSGLLDNIRISKGIARYTATFNPPDDYQAAPSYNKGQFFALF